MNKRLVRAKNWYLEYDRAFMIGVIVGLAGICFAQNRGIHSLNQFLEAEGLADKYYLPE